MKHYSVRVDADGGRHKEEGVKDGTTSWLWWVAGKYEEAGGRGRGEKEGDGRENDDWGWGEDNSGRCHDVRGRVGARRQGASGVAATRWGGRKWAGGRRRGAE